MSKVKKSSRPQKNFWQKLTAPHPSIEDFAERRFATALATLLLALLPLYFLPEGIRVLVERHSRINIAYFGVGILVLGTAYFLARSPFPRWGAALTMLYFTVLPFTSLAVWTARYAGDKAGNALIWSIPIMLMALILLHPNRVKWIVFLQIALYLIIPAVWAGLAYEQIFPTFWLVLAVGGLMILSAFVQGNYLRRVEIEGGQSKQVARELRKLSRAAEQVASGIVITNTEGIIEYANPAALRITGYTEDEMIGNTPSMLKSGEHDDAFYDQLWETIEHGETWRGELINRRKDGSLYWESQVISPVLDSAGEITHYVAVKEDVTKVKENEEHVRTLSSAVEQTANGVVITDADGRIEFANPAFTEISGYALDEVLGKTTAEIQQSGEHDESFYETLEATIRRGEIWKGDIVNRRKNGSLYWESLVISPVKNKDGVITNRVEIKEDITLRKKLEQSLALAHEEALVASEMKTQLLANVSHDMRTPLGAILGYTEMLNEGVFEPLNPQQAEATRAIAASSQRLLDFVTDLLNQAQIETGEVVLNETAFRPQRLIDGLGGEISLAKTQGMRVTTHIDDKLPQEILGDSYWLGQILHNLLSNAIKFTPDDGEVEIALLRSGENAWALRVADNGKGIPPEAQDYIFESFRQVDASTSREAPKGSGLGLSIVQHLVKLMRGEISLESEINKGSIFTVLLPLNMPEEPTK